MLEWIVTDSLIMEDMSFLVLITDSKVKAQSKPLPPMHGEILPPSKFPTYLQVFGKPLSTNGMDTYYLRDLRH